MKNIEIEKYCNNDIKCIFDEINLLKIKRSLFLSKLFLFFILLGFIALIILVFLSFYHFLKWNNIDISFIVIGMAVYCLTIECFTYFFIFQRELIKYLKETKWSDNNLKDEQKKFLKTKMLPIKLEYQAKNFLGSFNLKYNKEKIEKICKECYKNLKFSTISLTAQNEKLKLLRKLRILSISLILFGLIGVVTIFILYLEIFDGGIKINFNALFILIPLLIFSWSILLLGLWISYRIRQIMLFTKWYSKELILMQNELAIIRFGTYYNQIEKNFIDFKNTDSRN